MKRIMIATDGSESADAALEFAIDLARQTGSQLHVACVRPLAFHDPTRPSHGPERVGTIHGAERIAAAAAARASAAGIRVQAHFLCGPVAETLRDEARQLKVDLIVVGSRGLGAVTGTLLGSVSRALVREAPAPVMVVKAQRKQLDTDIAAVG